MPIPAAIGRIDARQSGDEAGAAFNVAIRTLEIDDAALVSRAILGLGSGIVADSRSRRRVAASASPRARS